MEALRQTIRRQTEAADPEASVWVSANAGTGKTHVLTQRVIRLLLNGTAPEKILCLTFTKAAAAEMAKRLFDTLGRWATCPDDELIEALENATGEALTRDVLSPARRLFAQALDTPGGLKIQTIHAFCERLLRRFPLEARVPPHFGVLDERTTAELLDKAAARVRDGSTDDQEDHVARALDVIVERIDETRFRDLLKEIAGKRSRLNRLLTDHGGVSGAAAFVAEQLGLMPGETEQTIAQAAVRDILTRMNELEDAAGILAGGSKTDKQRGAIIKAFFKSSDPVDVFDDYVNAFLKKDHEPQVKLLTNALRDNHPEIESLLYDEQGRIFDCYQRIKAARILAATHAVLTIAASFLDIYEQEKSLRAGLDYDDLILRTRDLITKSSSGAWVLYKLDGGIDHILVDEAQDTSPEQWEVITALAEEFFSGLGAHADRSPDVVRTMFAVGDEKQSIYSFQGADPEKFHEMREMFYQRSRAADQTWHSVDLDLSFRSTADILAVVDGIFTDMAVARSLTPSGDIIPHTPKRIGAAGLVELWPIVKPPDIPEPQPWDAPLDQQPYDSPRVVLARNITDTIAKWLDRGELLESQGRPIRPGDIMILVRRRDALMEEIIRDLKQRIIPVAGADRMILTDQIAVMDLMALGHFALMPRDDLTLAEVLKSPLIGLTDDDLFELAHDRPGHLWDALIGKGRHHSRQPFAAAHHALCRILARADVVPPYDFYQEILDQSLHDKLPGGKTGRQRLLRRLGRDAEDPINEFLNLALAYDRVSLPNLQGFLHWLAQGHTQLKREYDQDRNEVRVMTVHGAKGLQSNIVFLPDTCHMPDGHHDPMILDMPGGAVVWPGSKSNDDRKVGKQRERHAQNRLAEYHRLFYVAATRARDRLYIAGYQGQQDPKHNSWYSLAEKMICPVAQEVQLAFGETGWRLASDQTADIEKASAAQISDDGESSLPPWIFDAVSEERIRQNIMSPSSLPGPAADERLEPSILSPLAGDKGDRFIRGLIIHKLLENIPGVSKPGRQQVGRAIVRQLAPQFSASEADAVIEEVVRVIDDHAFAAVFGPGSRAEVSLAGRPTSLPNDMTIFGQVDRLVVSEDEVLVVDYKTNRPPPMEPSQVAPVYLRQMAVYRALLRDIFPNTPVRCALLWTDGPHLMALPDDLLTRALDHLALAQS